MLSSTARWTAPGRNISVACWRATGHSCRNIRLRPNASCADLCASEPAIAARTLVEDGFTSRYDYALLTLRDVPYDKWREYDPEDTLRFYALRLYDLGFVTSVPQKIIADSRDWRSLDEVKRELKV
jgi:NitT/TauT family transport system substrate-binding protein